MATTASCHHTCAVGDAGVPDAAGFDAGPDGGMIPTGACPGAGDTCDPIRPEGDGGTGMILVPTTPGICR